MKEYSYGNNSSDKTGYQEANTAWMNKYKIMEVRTHYWCKHDNNASGTIKDLSDYQLLNYCAPSLFQYS
jgi:hypothetical protein